MMPTNRSHSLALARQNESTSQSRAPKSSMLMHFQIGLLGAFRPIAEAVTDDADKQIALLGPGAAERVHIPVTRSEILHADALPDRTPGCLSAHRRSGDR